MEEKKKKKGFTLIELLAVIVILAIILVIAVPYVANVINKTKTKAYFASVSNLVDSIKPENVLENKDYCMYDYSFDEENKTDNIDNMYVLAHMEDGKIIYSVFATKEGQTTINVYDFNKLSIDNEKEWSEEPKEKSSASFYAYDLFNKTIQNEDGSLNQYQMCAFKN